MRDEHDPASPAVRLPTDDILEAISDGFLALDPDWRFTVFNAAAERAFAVRRAEVLGRTIWEVSPAIVGTEFERRYRAAMDDRVAQDFEIETRLRPGRIHEIRAFPLQDGIGIAFRDITERKVAEERQALLVHELNHRVKNILATVQSIASSSFRSAQSVTEAQEAFESRLFALSRVHDVLTRENWEGAGLREVVAEALAPFRHEAGDRCTIGGPPVRLSASLALAFAMALQELATNAVKYGALSNEAGRIAVTWQLAAAPDQHRVRLCWAETGGPRVEAPTRRGFGMRLLEAGLARELDGQSSIEFAETGVVCRIDARLAARGSGSPAHG